MRAGPQSQPPSQKYYQPLASGRAKPRHCQNLEAQLDGGLNRLAALSTAIRFKYRGMDRDHEKMTADSVFEAGGRS
jgi:hypothetical protein